jgi:hypothetical protein
MKINLLTIFLLTIQTTFGQTFSSDWTKFSDTKWTVELINDTSPFLDKSTQGEMIFQNRQNPEIEIYYSVYLNTDIDSSFRKKIKNWYFIQSCATITNKENTFISFEFKQFYYLLKPCHNCQTGTNKECAELVHHLNDYILDEKLKNEKKNGP